MNEQQFLEYDLSEIVFSIDDENSYKETYSKISDSISKFGFKVTANKFSVADSSKFGGEIGIVNENQLSNLIRSSKNIEIGQFTKPILVANGYMILKVNDKKIINNELDEKKILKDLIEFEKKVKFNQFSAIHFNKAKINSKIRAMNKDPILVVVGEPNSVFSEILLSRLNFSKKNPIILFISHKLLIKQLKILNYKTNFNFLSLKDETDKLKYNKLNIVDVRYKFKRPFEKASIKSNDYINKCFEEAINFTKKIK